jgi:hypothetical protein
MNRLDSLDRQACAGDLSLSGIVRLCISEGEIVNNDLKLALFIKNVDMACTRFG